MVTCFLVHIASPSAGEEGDHQGDPRADAADVGEEEAGEEEGGEEAGQEEGEEAEEEGEEEEEKEEEEGQEEEEEKEEEGQEDQVPGRKRPKGVHKSKASIAAGKKSAAAMKKKGVGLFATKTLSADLAAVCGKTKMSRLEVTKALWGYIKKNKLNKGRTITPDAKLKKVLPSNSSAGCAFRTDCML